MGSADGGSDEKPVHKVTLTKPFYMGKFPVTQEQYQLVMGANPSYFQGDKIKGGGGSGKHPVEQVSWDDAQEFCKRLSASSGRTVRLPTEAEWEYACRAGSGAKYCFGDDEGKLGDYAWYSANSGNATHPVGEKKPNKFGLYDMHGNVWEWCQDWYGDYPAKAVKNPAGPAAGVCRVLRGGSWDYYPGLCWSAGRVRDYPDDRRYCIGFRVVGVAPRTSV